MRPSYRVFSIVLLLLVRVVFIKSPADILHNLIQVSSAMTFTIIIIAYYILATVLPSKVYESIQIFGFCIYCYGGGIGTMLIFDQFTGLSVIPEVTEIFKGNLHPKGISIFRLFISIAYGVQ